jgi:hypothetical protein
VIEDSDATLQPNDENVKEGTIEIFETLADIIPIQPVIQEKPPTEYDIL